jgi:hypothetical protein
MMLNDLYANLKIPQSCYLGKKIFKKHFYELDLYATDQKAFSQDIEKITWAYTLKPETINIAQYTDEEREYLEIAVIEVTLKSPKRRKRIGEIIQRVIPYPVLLIFVHREEIALNVAEKRINRSDSSKITVEVVHDTPLLAPDNANGWQKDFLNDFCVTNFSYHNFYDFYQDMVLRIIALNCAVHTGCYQLTTEHTEFSETATAEKTVVYDTSNMRDKRLESLQELERLQQEQMEYRNKLKREKNMGSQVDLNIQIKKISDRIKEILDLGF